MPSATMTDGRLRALSGHRLARAWGLLAAAMLGLAVLLVVNQHRFDWDLDLIDIPALPLTAGVVTAGLLLLLVLPLVRAGVREDAATQSALLKLVIVVGLVLRVLMFATEPALEDDQQRYLWEGGMVAHGLSPYALAPKAARSAPEDSVLADLADDGDAVLARVNHAHLKTIYPPVAQGAFALAHVISPWSLAAWRLVVLGAEVAMLAILLSLLATVGRPALWVALYWWNPVAVKELMNSGHMDGILMMFVMLALWLAARSRPIAATAALGLAAGTKLWPALLAPLIWRPLLATPRVLVAAMAVMLAMLAAWAAPIILGGLDQTSGFRAYAAEWQSNSAHLPALRDTLARVLAALGMSGDAAGSIVRAALAMTAGAVAVALAYRPIDDATDLLRRASLFTLALVLASPAQFPWYMLWTMPFLVFVPRWGVMAMAVTVPLYYSGFYFRAHEAFATFRDQVVWLIWIPIWTLLLVELAAYLRTSRPAGASGDTISKAGT